MKGRAEINRGGRVDGNVTSKTLVVEEGAVFQGQSIMDQQAAQAQDAKQQPQQQSKGDDKASAEEARV